MTLLNAVGGGGGTASEGEGGRGGIPHGDAGFYTIPPHPLPPYSPTASTFSGAGYGMCCRQMVGAKPPED